MERLRALFVAFAPKITQQQQNINSVARSRFSPGADSIQASSSLGQQRKQGSPDNTQSKADPPLSVHLQEDSQLYLLVNRYMENVHLQVVSNLTEAGVKNHEKEKEGGQEHGRIKFHSISPKSQSRSPRKQQSPEEEAEQKEKLREAQKKRLQLMDQLRRLDHKMDEIKNSPSRVMSNGSRADGLHQSLNKSQLNSRLNSHTNSQSELQKHEEAMRLIRKLNEEKRQREDKKTKKIEGIKRAQQAEIEALLVAKAKEAEARREKLSKASAYNPNNSSTRALKGLNTESQSQLEKGTHISRKGSYLPTISNKLSHNSENKKAAMEKASIEVTLDPTKKYFPKGKVYHQILQEQKILKTKDSRQLQQKQQLLSKRKDYKRIKVQLTPISLTQSLTAAPNLPEVLEDGVSTDPSRLREKKSTHSESLPVGEGSEKHIENGEVETTEPEVHLDKKSDDFHNDHQHIDPNSLETEV